jgi:hypothetical protein
VTETKVSVIKALPSDRTVSTNLLKYCNLFDRAEKAAVILRLKIYINQLTVRAGVNF